MACQKKKKRTTMASCSILCVFGNDYDLWTQIDMNFQKLQCLASASITFWPENYKVCVFKTSIQTCCKNDNSKNLNPVPQTIKL